MSVIGIELYILVDIIGCLLVFIVAFETAFR